MELVGKIPLLQLDMHLVSRLHQGHGGGRKDFSHKLHLNKVFINVKDVNNYLYRIHQTCPVIICRAQTSNLLTSSNLREK